MPSRCRATGSASSAAKIPNSMCRATNSSSGPEAMVVAIRGRCPRRNASRTAGLSWRNHLTSMAHLPGAPHPTASRAYLQLSVQRELGLELEVHPVSVLGADESLLLRWLDCEISPLFERHRALAEASLRRKIACLSESVATSL